MGWPFICAGMSFGSLVACNSALTSPWPSQPIVKLLTDLYLSGNRLQLVFILTVYYSPPNVICLAVKVLIQLSYYVIFLFNLFFVRWWNWSKRSCVSFLLPRSPSCLVLWQYNTMIRSKDIGDTLGMRVQKARKLFPCREIFGMTLWERRFARELAQDDDAGHKWGLLFRKQR